MLLAWPDVIVFALGPIGVLLLVSGLRTTRERLWLSAIVAWTVLWLFQPAGVATQIIRGGGIMVTGAFVAAVLWRPERLGRNVAIAVSTGLAGALWWTWILGVTWERIEFALTRATWATYQTMASSMAAFDGPGAAEDAAAGIALMVRLFPGLTVLAAGTGLLVAWAVYQRVAFRPVGGPAAPFTNFRGSDHLLWGLVVPLAILISPAGDTLDLVAVNALLVFGVIYVIRGAAILTWFMRSKSRLGSLGLGLLAVAALFVLPIAGSGLLLLGIVDTWIDIRRRPMPPPSTRGELP
ncbi:MAG: DUF2232 domain-containing protein [Gemmatimonadetes bacterium]|nr:DUF2232 domain-containing protein [Gemmatimonadota bacterium]